MRFLLGVLALAVAPLAAAQSSTPPPAKDTKIIFDISDANPRVLLNKLGAIDDLRQELIGAGVTPRMVLSSRGHAGRFVHTEIDKMAPEDRDVAAAIAAKLRGMQQAPGVEGLQQCLYSNAKMSIPRHKVLPGVRVVENSWVAIVAYQQQGYAYISP